MRLEKELIEYLLCTQQVASTLGSLRNEYTFLSYDLLHQLDECFKQFLVDFFYAVQLPAYAMFIKNDGANHRSEFILNNFEQSLQPAVFQKLLAGAVATATPYIPIIRFFRQKANHPIPVLPVYRWEKKCIDTEFTYFSEKYFPEYKNFPPAQFIHLLMEKIKPLS